MTHDGAFLSLSLYISLLCMHSMCVSCTHAHSKYYETRAHENQPKQQQQQRHTMKNEEKNIQQHQLNTTQQHFLAHLTYLEKRAKDTQPMMVPLNGASVNSVSLYGQINCIPSFHPCSFGYAAWDTAVNFSVALFFFCFVCVAAMFSSAFLCCACYIGTNTTDHSKFCIIFLLFCLPRSRLFSPFCFYSSSGCGGVWFRL